MGSSRALDGLPACLRGHPPPEDRWRDLLDLANRSLITPRLALALGDAEGVPDDVRAFLDEVLRRNRARNAALTDQLLQARDALVQAGIEPVLLKGAGTLLGEDANGRDGRMMVDIDLLVEPREVEAAIAALTAIGYSLHSRRTEPDVHVVAELVRDGDWGMIDLHQRPSGPPGMAEIEDLRLRARRLPGGGLIPDTAAQLYLLALHDQFHDGDYWSGRMNLRHLLDIADLLRSPAGMDWGRLNALAPTQVVRNALRTLLVGACWLTGATLPADYPLGAWPRVQHWRRLQQLERPWTAGALSVATVLFELPNLPAHRRADREGRARLFASAAPGGSRALPERLTRLRHIFAAPGGGKL